MDYAVIELLSLNFALSPLLCKTDVTGSVFCQSVVNSFLPRNFACFRIGIFTDKFSCYSVFIK